MASIDKNCFEKVDLFIKCSDLPKIQTFSDTDAFAIVYTVDKKMNTKKKVDNSETVINHNSPTFVKAFGLNYMFEAIQEVVVEIYHQDTKYHANMLEKHVFLGQGTFLLSNLMCSHNQSMKLAVQGGKGVGNIEVSGYDSSWIDGG